MHKLQNKKVGIWGLGVVGKSALSLVQKYTPHIQLLDKNVDQQMPYPVILQSTQTIQDFLAHNDIIIPSPGIPLGQYQQYQHKFLTELDIIAEHKLATPTIAITGTVGKTTITSLLNQSIPDSIAIGNIGTPMLDLVTKPSAHSCHIFELSSAQLQHSKNFTPDIAIMTNFFANHLDYHANVQEYLQAKCNLFAHQTEQQRALIPVSMIDEILPTITPKSQVYLFAVEKPHITLQYPCFYISENNIMLAQQGKETVVYHDTSQLPDITFTQNWLIIIATLYLAQMQQQNIDVRTIDFAKLAPQQHRIEWVKNIGSTAVYNDSKSTIWQSTQFALAKFSHKKIALIIGGMSKGIDRSPLMAHLKNPLITVFIFGQETPDLSRMCEQQNVTYFACHSLPDVVEKVFAQPQAFDVLLFSPSGSSFDLFKNYQERGNYFKQLILQR